MALRRAVALAACVGFCAALCKNATEEEVTLSILLGDDVGFMRYAATWRFDAWGSTNGGGGESGEVELDAGTDAPLPLLCAAPGEYLLEVLRPAASCGAPVEVVSCVVPTPAPLPAPTRVPTRRPTAMPLTRAPTIPPTETKKPSAAPSRRPAPAPTRPPAPAPSPRPTTPAPSTVPTARCFSATVEEEGSCTSAACRVVNALAAPAFEAGRCFVAAAALTTSYGGDLAGASAATRVAPDVAGLAGDARSLPSCDFGESACALGDFLPCAATSAVDVTADLDAGGAEIFVEAASSVAVDDCGGGAPAFRVRATLDYTVCCNAPCWNQSLV